MRKVSKTILSDHITVDSWSIGCVLMDILFKKHLFSGVNSIETLKEVLDYTGKRTKIGGHCFIDYYKKKFPDREPDIVGMLLAIL